MPRDLIRQIKSINEKLSASGFLPKQKQSIVFHQNEGMIPTLWNIYLNPFPNVVLLNEGIPAPVQL